MKWFELAINMYTACDTWYEASCRGSLEYWTCSGDLHLNWRKRGYRTVFDLLQNKIPAESPNQVDVESKVLLNKKVTKIVYSPTNAPSKRIKVRCLDGSEFDCDHLICTVSLGVLKEQHLSLFEPSLPLSKIRSIDGVGFGTVDKIFIEFADTFWSDDWLGISFLWKPEQLKVVRADPVNSCWLEHIMGIYPVDFQPNTLLAWISGVPAAKMEVVSDSDFENGVRMVLNMFLKNVKSGWHVKRVARFVFSSENFINLRKSKIFLIFAEQNGHQIHSFVARIHFHR